MNLRTKYKEKLREITILLKSHELLAYIINSSIVNKLDETILIKINPNINLSLFL